jgi:DNA-binding NarL/FixJ family response regulator
MAVASVAELLQGDIGLQGSIVLLSLGSKDIVDSEVRNDIASLSQSASGVPIVIVGDREDSHQVGEALLLGARGYIPTTLTARVVVESLRLIQAGGTFVPACAFSEVLTQRRSERPEPAPKAMFNLAGLTPRQREVFDLLRRGKPNKIIAYELSMCESTVKVHVRQIMRKLQASNRTQAAFLAARVPDQNAA